MEETLNTHEPGNEINRVLAPVFRVQRLRKKGYKTPENTVYVGRPTKWGNPFKVIGEKNIWFVVEENDAPICSFETEKEALDCCVELYREYISHQHNLGIVNVFDLKGKNLSCWCPPNKPCHVDVLLSFLNRR